MPSNFELYRVRGDELNDQFFNIRFRDIDARLTHVEANIIDIESIANSLIEHGLELVNTQLQATLTDINEQLNAAQGLVQQVEQQVQDIEDAIEDILGSGSLPATNVSLDSIGNLDATDVQAALAEIQGDIDGILVDISSLVDSVTQNAIDLTSKAPLTSPTFSGTPVAPTPPPGNNSTRIATTAFVANIFQGTVQTTRQVLGGGLVTGGGDLNQDRTLTVDKTSVSEFRGGTNDTKALTTKTIYDAAAFIPISYSSVLTLNLDDGLNREVTLAGNVTLNNPLNAKPGTSGCLKIDTNGSDREINYGSAWKAAGGPLPLSDTDTIDYLFFYVVASNLIIYSIVNDPQ